MSEKSHVGLETHLCLVCAKPFETGTLLLDRRLRPSLDKHTCTGWGLCPEHEALYKQGFIALVGCDEAKSERLPNGSIGPDGAYRTGEVAHVRERAFAQIFNVPAHRSDGTLHPVIFADQQVIEIVKRMTS